jgi:hypothetical protein
MVDTNLKLTPTLPNGLFTEVKLLKFDPKTGAETFKIAEQSDTETIYHTITTGKNMNNGNPLTTQTNRLGLEIESVASPGNAISTLLPEKEIIAFPSLFSIPKKFF